MKSFKYHQGANIEEIEEQQNVLNKVNGHFYL